MPNIIAMPATENWLQLSEEKINSELKEFKGGQKEQAVKTFVASTLLNFCKQSEVFAKVVASTVRTLSDCCRAVMKDSGTHISDIDVYRGAVKFYFPDSEINFTMTIQTGTAPTAEEMAKPAEVEAPKPTPKPKPEKKKAEKPKPKEKPAPVAAPAPAKKKEAPQPEFLQLSIF